MTPPTHGKWRWRAARFAPPRELRASAAVCVRRLGVCATLIVLAASSWRVAPVHAALPVNTEASGLADAPVLVHGSRLAYPGAAQPFSQRTLGQRTIEREWGLPEGKVRVVIAGWRSEGFALALSAAAPGTGQAFVGDGGGWWYGVVEAIGWATHFFFERQARAIREDSERYAGVPSDPTSTWSFQRWEQASGGDRSEIEALYHLDREVYFDRIGSDPRFASGWAGDGSGRATFNGLRDRSDARLRTKRVADIALVTNHVVAAFDALRAARRHNRPIERELELKVGPRWLDQQPAMAAALERRF